LAVANSGQRLADVGNDIGGKVSEGEPAKFPMLVRLADLRFTRPPGCNEEVPSPGASFREAMKQMRMAQVGRIEIDTDFLLHFADGGGSDRLIGFKPPGRKTKIAVHPAGADAPE